MTSPPPVRRLRSKQEQREESIELLLDAAEYLFSQHGFHGVTLKEVAKHVGVNTSLVHYYFENKRALFDQVFKRRSTVATVRLTAALDEYEAGCAGEPTIEGALHAFLDTCLDLSMSGGDGWRNFGGLVSNTTFGNELMDLFNPVVLRLIKLLRRAMPDVAESDVFWGFHFAAGALFLTLARTGRLDRLSGGVCQSDDFEPVKRRMARFMAAGFRELAEHPSNDDFHPPH